MYAALLSFLLVFELSQLLAASADENSTWALRNVNIALTTISCCLLLIPRCLLLLKQYLQREIALLNAISSHTLWHWIVSVIVTVTTGLIYQLSIPTDNNQECVILLIFVVALLHRALQQKPTVICSYISWGISLAFFLSGTRIILQNIVVAVIISGIICLPPVFKAEKSDLTVKVAALLDTSSSQIDLHEPLSNDPVEKIKSNKPNKKQELRNDDNNDSNNDEDEDLYYSSAGWRFLIANVSHNLRTVKQISFINNIFKTVFSL